MAPDSVEVEVGSESHDVDLRPELVLEALTGGFRSEMDQTRNVGVATVPSHTLGDVALPAIDTDEDEKDDTEQHLLHGPGETESRED